MRRRANLAGALLVGVLAAACSGPAPDADPQWTQLDPDGAEPVTLTSLGDRLLLGTYAAGSPTRPGLSLMGPGDGLTPLTVSAKSVNGPLARWLVLAASGTELVGVGGNANGAHGNTRWTTWSGSMGGGASGQAVGGVTEQPQDFWTFGGWEAGGIVGATWVGGAPVIVGSWKGAAAGTDIATWTREGDTWSHRPATGTDLASTTTALAQAQGVAATAGTAVIAGSLTRLDSGVTERPAVWLSRSARGPWTRIELPGDAGRAEAVGCDERRCLVLGRSGSRLRAWWVAPAGAAAQPQVTPADPPVAALAESDHLAAPAVRGESAWAPVRDDGHSVVLAAGHRGWRRSPAPPGIPTAVAVLDNRLVTIIRATAPGAAPASALWTGAVPLAD
ncbi:MAG: hypothetical protein LWW86_02480 [Micrococcales bacterium]|nr:hypothetical protein [Micrococcales bacterium]